VNPPVPERPDQPREAPAATSAWRPGDPVGHRRFVTVVDGRPFHLETGGVLRHVEVAYETWGELSPAADNAVLVCHALTGDSHAAGRAGDGHPVPGWWDDLIGPGRALDTDRWFVVCPNVLGGCQGTTGPSSLDPLTGKPYGSAFPVVSIRDMVRVQARLADELGIARWHCVVGGSMGGMQVLEWGVMYPDRCRSLMPIATTAAATAQQIAYSAIQRNAIALDPNWRGGDYYDAPDGEGPHRGLALARQLAQVTYRSDEVFNERFGRQEVESIERGSLWQRFTVEGYLDYHGMKLVRRFDANSYLVIAKSMDLHDLGRSRGGIEAALARIRCPVRTMSIDSDALYPPYQQALIVQVCSSVGGRAEDVTIHSPHGHDAFLLETDQVGATLRRFLDEVEHDR
jgi:homoserine O-acetyltransferase/O-succinyltransferase